MIVDHTERDQEEGNLQIDGLRDRLGVIASILRWLWTTSFLAAVVGIGAHLYWLAAVAGISSAIFLVGAGEGRKAVRRLTNKEIQR